MNKPISTVAINCGAGVFNLIIRWCCKNCSWTHDEKLFLKRMVQNRILSFYKYLKRAIINYKVRSSSTSEQRIWKRAIMVAREPCKNGIYHVYKSFFDFS